MRPARPPRAATPAATLTLDEGSAEELLAGAPPDCVTALVLVGSKDEGHRVGELCLVPGGTRAEALLGRAPPTRGEATPHLALMRQRPGQSEVTGPLGAPQISRDQLHLSGEPGGLRLRNVGRCPLLVNGEPTDEAALSPGDRVELKGVALFLAVHRPWTLPTPPEGTPPWPDFAFGMADPYGIVGEGPAVWALRSQLAFLAGRAAHVLVHGPSGAGKELVAQALHARSARAGKPLVSRNAATLPEGLVDAELFGNVKNYPNPGMIERPGLVGEADGGTLFLDELGELPLPAQAHLLRVLESGEYSRLGEARPRRADLRLIAATNRPLGALKEDVAARFRLRLPLPDLNQRREDLPLIARHLLLRAAQTDATLARRAFPQGDLRKPPLISFALLHALLRRRWTTHVRELEALLWEALAGPGALLEPGPTLLVEAAPEPPRASPVTDPFTLKPEDIQASLDRHHGRQGEVVTELGLSSRHVLHRLIKRYGLRSGRPGEG